MKYSIILNRIRIFKPFVAVLSLSILYIPVSVAQHEPDLQLLKEIMEIWAIDNHSHASPFIYDTADNSKSGNPLGEAPFAYPVRLRLDNPEYIEAWHELYGYAWKDMKVEHTRSILEKKRLLMREQGVGWPEWILDKVYIRTIFVNLPGLGAGQQTPRFRWVPTANALVIPFKLSEDKVTLKRVVERLIADLKLNAMPETLNNYTEFLLTPAIQRWKEEGAIAIKIALAYERPLDFKNVSETEAAKAYSSLVENKRISDEEYKVLQDYLFCYLARECGRSGLPVHIHTGIGADPYFNVSGSNPLLLEPVLNDSSMRQTTFVLIHGGWPFDKEAGVLTIKPNVYIDFSAQTFLRSVRSLSAVLREWLEWYPEKILFGTDAYSDPQSPLSAWEEKVWLSNYSARNALAIALSAMIEDKEISKEKAIELARMVLYENAARLYSLNKD